MPKRYLVVTIDTEVDRDRDWRIAAPATFSSVVEGIPETLTPLFARYGVRPTYLVSAEVLEDQAAVRALQATEAELGTHLHAEFVEPMRLVAHDRMAGARQNTIQAQYPPEIERAKLATITELFRDRIGRVPRSFRAGRYGMSAYTLDFLAELGYEVDSSVTPGILWNYPEGRIDYRSRTTTPQVVATPFRPIVELPITIEPSSLVNATDGLPVGAASASRLASVVAPHRWLRPTRSSGADLIGIAGREQGRVCVLMFHTVEIMPGRSPYAASEADVRRILGNLEELIAWWTNSGNGFYTLSEAASLVRMVEAT